MITVNKKLEAGQRVTARLFPAENAIDTAIVDNAALIIALVKARQDLQQPAGVFQSVLDETYASGVELMNARKKIVGAHARIVKLRDELGMPEHGYGCETPCPWDADVEPVRLDSITKAA